MARQQGTYKLTSNIEPRAAAPLDAREKVALKNDLTATGTFPYPYEGMEVYVVEEKKKYILIGDDPTKIDNWFENGGDKTSILFVEELPEAPNIENVIYALYSPIITTMTMICDYREIEKIEGFIHNTQAQEFTVTNGYRIQVTGSYQYIPPRYIQWIRYTGTGIEEGDNYPIHSEPRGFGGTGSTIAAKFNSTIPLQIEKVHYEYYIGSEEDQILEKLGSDLVVSYLTADDIDDLMESVSQQQWSYLADIIVDTETSVSKVWSSNKVRAELNTTLDDAKSYTNEQLSHFSTTTYKMAADVSEVVDRDYMYLIPVAGTLDNYEIYVLVDDTPTAIGTTQVQLDNFYTKAETDNRYLRLTEAALGYISTTKYNQEIGNLSSLQGYTATNVVGALNEINTFENVNIDFEHDF